MDFILFFFIIDFNYLLKNININISICCQQPWGDLLDSGTVPDLFIEDRDPIDIIYGPTCGISEWWRDLLDSGTYSTAHFLGLNSE